LVQLAVAAAAAPQLCINVAVAGGAAAAEP